MELVSEYLGGFRDISRAEISGLLEGYGGKIEGETEKLLFFSTDNPYKIVSRVAFSKRVGRIIGQDEPITINEKQHYSIRENRIPGRDSLISTMAKRINGKVDLDRPDVRFYIYNFSEPIFTELIYERKMGTLIDVRYRTKPMNHPSSISPVLARGMINISGIKEGEKFVDPFAGTGTFLIEGFRMGIDGYGIDRSWKMLEGGNLNLRHFNFPEVIMNGDFSELENIGGFSAVITDPPYGRGAKVFSESREYLYTRLFSLLSRVRGSKVFCIPSVELLKLAREYLPIKLAGEIRVHSSLTRYVVHSK
ncbi:MAG: hypothetical protein M1123_01875 [Candidatus Thermoplasmatota archaeon]|nr:hypothetical protein [Candidatus Thermoplasmatota archaeon]